MVDEADEIGSQQYDRRADEVRRGSSANDLSDKAVCSPGGLGPYQVVCANTVIFVGVFRSRSRSVISGGTTDKVRSAT